MSAAIPDTFVRPVNRLEHFPVALFASSMGLSGLAIAWQQAHKLLGAPVLVVAALRGMASALFLLLLVAYAGKWLHHRRAALEEAGHPARAGFLATVSISILLLAAVWMEQAPRAAGWIWAAGALLHIGLTLRTMHGWLHHDRHLVAHVNPSWFIPVVGNLVVPVAGVRFASPEVSWFFFSVGIVFWAVLLTIVLYRLFFHEPLPPKLVPTLFILLAPPAVGFVAWTSLTGQVDAFGRVLFYFALFIGLLLAADMRRFLALPFFASSWACSFPLAALTVAALAMLRLAGNRFLAGLALALLALLTLVVALLAFRTLLALRRGELCVPD
ncbi:SLAC1 anion channel family protein [Noviherbaspirillum aridicola]|uniref:Transporter n=1 Tax=Noviherbaspirillum aridicola TaxID=2849687 RepID=A0ABQ4Q1J9_9BURK|nr:SLAC1 anion channel family protein [Noviherbaspirillum aridicola]GIZ50916.1 transporter [Noviherbaspirillum aridicola]